MILTRNDPLENLLLKKASADLIRKIESNPEYEEIILLCKDYIEESRSELRKIEDQIRLTSEERRNLERLTELLREAYEIQQQLQAD